MIGSLFSRLIILFFGTLYPAYASFKAVRTKNVKEFVMWMIYWIVLAFFTCIEAFTDIFVSWIPFYYEIKVVIVLWLLAPATRGSSILYLKIVHPILTRREQKIDEYLNRARDWGWSAVLQLGSKGINVILETAIKTCQLATQLSLRLLQSSQFADEMDYEYTEQQQRLLISELAAMDEAAEDAGAADSSNMPDRKIKVTTLATRRLTRSSSKRQQEEGE